MPQRPDIERVQKLLRRQQSALKIALAGFLLIGVGAALGFGVGFNSAGIIVGAAGAFVALVMLLVSVVFVPLVSLAMKKATADLAAGAPIEPGERFGRMKVMIADGDTLHLSLDQSPLSAGSARLLVCFGLVALSIAMFWMVASGVNPAGKPALLGGLAVCLAVVLASVPFAMQWIVGDVIDGQPGIAIERVRWFFKRDTLNVPAEDIAQLILTDVYLTLKTTSGLSVLLIRTPQGVLSVWEKRRLAEEIARTIGRRIAVKEVVNLPIVG